MNDNITYKASVYSRKITYINFKGERNTVEMQFALDPLQLLEVIASVDIKTVKSGDPRKNGKRAEITDEQQLKLVRDLAQKSAGWPSEDGESWESYENFNESLAGKAFLTKLASSDADRREFSERVILDPFRAFIEYAKADEGNDAKEIAEFDKMLEQMENIFQTPEDKEEALAEKRAKLAAELDALGPDEDE